VNVIIGRIRGQATFTNIKIAGFCFGPCNGYVVTNRPINIIVRIEYRCRTFLNTYFAANQVFAAAAIGDRFPGHVRRIKPRSVCTLPDFIWGKGGSAVVQNRNLLMFINRTKHVRFC